MYSYSDFMAGSDRFGGIDPSEERMQYLFRNLEFPVETILKAVQEVGYEPDEVEEYIRDRMNRY
ncbi:MAG TPA: hypothetical protein VFZ78_13235 [Flavisolibacter sp.]